MGVSGQELTIRGSFAATTVSGSANAGGLVGYAGAHVSVTGSYADCYLTAPVTGGLVGGAAQGAYTTLTNCYAVGYQTAGTRAAGLVNGTLDRAEATYSACAFFPVVNTALISACWNIVSSRFGTAFLMLLSEAPSMLHSARTSHRATPRRRHISRLPGISAGGSSPRTSLSMRQKRFCGCI